MFYGPSGGNGLIKLEIENEFFVGSSLEMGNRIVWLANAQKTRRIFLSVKF